MADETTPGKSTDTPKSGKSGAARLGKIFKAAVKNGASDIHLKAGAPPRFRIGGIIRLAASDPLANEDLEEMVLDSMDSDKARKFLEEGSMDFAYQLPGSNRFRVNVFRQRGLVSVAARKIPTEILDYAKLHLPPILEDVAKLHQGLILVAGITGSGKSTTIAAMIEQINQTRGCHIVTVEDPIEFLYEDKKSFVNQREIGLDVPNFHEALKYLMREDPDVVLIGEMRDQETFSAALHAAESGHLCFGTVHASNAGSTITRVLELFPEEARELVRTSLVFNLQAVVCLKLLVGIRKDIPRIPAAEILIVNSTVRKLIAEGREGEIINVIKASYGEGMQDFNESLRKLVQEEFISTKTGYDAAPNPDELKMRLKGIQVSGGGIIG
ncbi:MAG: type IV pilus twitching motility protein PilT [Phycisphaerae bacterium]